MGIARHTIVLLRTSFLVALAALLLLLALGLGTAGSASAAAYYTLDNTGAGCTFGVWDPSSMTCTMTGDISGDFSASDAIEITGNGLTLDGDNHTISSSVGTLFAGISMDGVSSVALKNLQVTGFGNGVLAYNGTGIVIEESSFTRNPLGAVLLYAQQGARVQGNTISGSEIGLDIRDSQQAEVSGNTITGNAIGLDLYWSEKSNVHDNTLIGNDVGIFMVYSNNNMVSHNLVTENGLDPVAENQRAGIALFGSEFNIIANNYLARNHEGINVAFADGCGEEDDCDWNEERPIGSGNKINGNDFVDNETQASAEFNYKHAIHGSCCPHPYEDTYEMDGNFWSTWTGPDNDGDGIVDKPFGIVKRLYGAYSAVYDKHPRVRRVTDFFNIDPHPTPVHPAPVQPFNDVGVDATPLRASLLPDTGIPGWLLQCGLLAVGLGVLTAFMAHRGERSVK